jgi:hypothetical protein
MSETKTFWLSFTDPDRPKGDQFLGVAVVDVTDADVARAAATVAKRYPNAQRGAEWIAAAIKKAHAMGCNPGGQVATMEMPRAWPKFKTCPRNELMSRARLLELDL